MTEECPTCGRILDVEMGDQVEAVAVCRRCVALVERLKTNLVSTITKETDDGIPLSQPQVALLFQGVANEMHVQFRTADVAGLVLQMRMMKEKEDE